MGLQRFSPLAELIVDPYRRTIVGLFKPVVVAVALLSLGCAPEDTSPSFGEPFEAEQPTSPLTTTTLRSLPTTTRVLVDSQEILDRYGFEVCDGPAPPADISVERGKEILDRAFATGHSVSGSPGGDGRMTIVGLAVLEDVSLSSLADITTPDETCVHGMDPNDYVPDGPQLLEGPGWRWVGAGRPVPSGSRSIVSTQDEYDELWTYLGEGPETDQIEVDFDTEVIIILAHGSGVNFGPCGQRFDGFAVHESVVVVDMFSPGGAQPCDLAARGAAYAVALDSSVVGDPPFDVAWRSGPRQPAGEVQTTKPISFESPAPPPTEVVPPPSATTVPPPPPTATPSPVVVSAGIDSEPTFGNRVGELEVTGFDAPLPAGWEARSVAPSLLRIGVVGRGGLEVARYSIDDTSWWAAITTPDAILAGESEPVSLALMEIRDGQVVTSGVSIDGSQYRFSTQDSIVESVVRRFDLGREVIVMRVDYPNFALMGSPESEDPVMGSLTGLAPEELLDDIRILSR